jgi:hypothetical protein
MDEFTPTFPELQSGAGAMRRPQALAESSNVCKLFFDGALGDRTKLRDGLPITGNNESFAEFHVVEEAREVGFGLVGSDGLHGPSID